MIDILLSIARTSKSDANRIAANAVLDRAYGKPKETKEIEVSRTKTRRLAIDSLTDEQLEAFEVALTETVLKLEAHTIEADAD
jgi:hypothetical protein